MVYYNTDAGNMDKRDKIILLFVFCSIALFSIFLMAFAYKTHMEGASLIMELGGAFMILVFLAAREVMNT